MMERVQLADGTFLSYDRYGTGPPLILVHGALTNQQSNWPAVKDLFAERFTVYAVARRGRGETTAPLERSLEDEFGDIAAFIRSVGQPSFVLGHSGGAVISMHAAATCPELVSKLVLYEPPNLGAGLPALMPKLESAAEQSDWDLFVRTFLLEGPKMPAPLVDASQASPFWPLLVADGPATLADLRSAIDYKFDPARVAALTMPVLLLLGSESPRDNYLTDALAADLPDASIAELPGQGHIAQQLAPQLFVEAVTSFLNSPPGSM